MADNHAGPRVYMAKLNEYCQKKRARLDYKEVDVSGPAHDRVFTIAVLIDARKYSPGTGKSKKEARAHAALLAWEIIQKELQAERSATPTSDSLNNSQGSSPEASVNDTDLESDCKSAADKLANQFGAIQLIEASPSSLANPKGPAVKSKRKETQLAPKFSTLNPKEREFTINQKFLEDFEDIQRISSGGYGTVFKAKQAIDNRLCAVKRVKLIAGEEETKIEVQVLAKLDHENIVRYFNCWIGKDHLPSEDSISDNRLMEADCLFIMMEYCEKGTLENWIRTESEKESYKEDVKIKFQQIVKGVKYIHSKDLIHRDLKPINIFISRDNKIKIGDFGLVTSGVDDLSVQRTQNRGTVSYMAPEQVGSHYGMEVDIFPLGLILFEMLCAFETCHERLKVLKNIRQGKFPETFVKKFPEEKFLIKKLLSNVPSQRPSATDILFLLKNSKYTPHTC
ncbi:interferon-induced, double-stranded RNA-activated protein kinase isoform X2 [Rhineura floridana]|uniref:interferon-induced, double-stranded RNA-activated protein kinase isoform X2 n=1 Tax=Rhineura floridana TaxID=261503 RepID=UPI002AC860CF|nr:interferon-induced, double-stranded RNA-activated protein kinase isoform X2 [Rhineura floridana]